MSPLLPLLLALSQKVKGSTRRGIRLLRGTKDLIPYGAAEGPLASYIYRHHFCRSDFEGNPAGNLRFVEILTQATGAIRYREAGWQVTSSDKPWAYVSNGKLKVFIDDRAEMHPRNAVTGNEVLVKIPCARPNILDGYFCLFSPAGPVLVGIPSVDIFLNVTATMTPRLVRGLLASPTAQAIPYTAFIANDPAGFVRCEPVVLRLSAKSFPKMFSILRRLHRAHRTWWRAETPIFTYPMLPGVSIAEAPPLVPRELDSTYGMHRCRLIARGVLSAVNKGHHDPQAWMREVKSTFVRAGIDWRKPYLRLLRMEHGGRKLSFSPSS